MSEDIYQDIAQAYAAAAEKAPGLKSRFTAAGFDPAAVTSVADLSRLPVMKKEELLKIQRENPPFGGFLASDLKDIGRIYVSPGPIFEPALSDRLTTNRRIANPAPSFRIGTINIGDRQKGRLKANSVIEFSVTRVST